MHTCYCPGTVVNCFIFYGRGTVSFGLFTSVSDKPFACKLESCDNSMCLFLTFDHVSVIENLTVEIFSRLMEKIILDLNIFKPEFFMESIFFITVRSLAFRLFFSYWFVLQLSTVLGIC